MSVCFGVGCGDGSPDPELPADAGTGLDCVDLVAFAREYGPGDVEASTTSSVLEREPELEHPLPVALGDTAAVIAHVHGIAVGIQRNDAGALSRRMARWSRPVNRVVYEIHEHRVERCAEPDEFVLA